MSVNVKAEDLEDSHYYFQKAADVLKLPDRSRASGTAEGGSV